MQRLARTASNRSEATGIDQKGVIVRIGTGSEPDDFYYFTGSRRIALINVMSTLLAIGVGTCKLKKLRSVGGSYPHASIEDEVHGRASLVLGE